MAGLSRQRPDPPTSGSVPRTRAGARSHHPATRHACGQRRQRESRGGILLRLARPSRPLLRETSGAAPGARRCRPGSGPGPAHPLLRVGPNPTGARHAAPRLTRARVSPAEPGTTSGEDARPSLAPRFLPCPEARRTRGTWASEHGGLGARARGTRPRGARAARPPGEGLARCEAPGEGRARKGPRTRALAHSVGPSQGSAAEAQARPRPLAKGRAGVEEAEPPGDSLVPVDPRGF